MKIINNKINNCSKRVWQVTEFIKDKRPQEKCYNKKQLIIKY